MQKRRFIWYELKNQLEKIYPEKPRMRCLSIKSSIFGGNVKATTKLNSISCSSFSTPCIFLVLSPFLRKAVIWDFRKLGIEQRTIKQLGIEAN